MACTPQSTGNKGDAQREGRYEGRRSVFGYQKDFQFSYGQAVDSGDNRYNFCLVISSPLFANVVSRKKPCRQDLYP